MELTLAYAIGENAYDGMTLNDDTEVENVDFLVGRRVLLVDDNDMNRELMQEILTDRGLVVEEADNGNSAVEQIKEHEPGYYHFVLMDLEMPEMDGYEATVRIRSLQNRIRANVPIIALTANGFLEDRIQAQAAGMDDFLVKPVNSAHLLRSLAKFR